MAQRIKIRGIDRVGSRLVLKFHPAALADLAGLTRVLKRQRGSLTPQGILTLPLTREAGPAVLDETVAVLNELYGYNIMS
jgi:hypothetical protein